MITPTASSTGEATVRRRDPRGPMPSRATRAAVFDRWRAARFVVSVVTASMVLTLAASPGDAADGEVADPDAQIAAIDDQVAQAEEQADAAQSRLEDLAIDLISARDELVQIKRRLDDAEARLRTLDGQLALAERELDDRQASAERAAILAARAAERLSDVEHELSTEEQRLDDQAATSFMRGTTAKPEMMLQLLEEGNDPGNLAADVYRLGVVLDRQTRLVKRVDDLRVDSTQAAEEAREQRLLADEAEAEAAAAVALVTDLRTEAADVREQTAMERDRQAELITALEADADEQEVVLASVEAEVEQLAAERRQAVAERIRQQVGEDSGTATGPCPVDGAIVGRDFTNDWGHPRSGGRRHEGTDVFAVRGTPLRAIADGTVKNVRRADESLGGRVVSIWVAEGEHWYYAHLETVAEGLEEGQPVTAGQVLGTVGDSGNARGTPPHLHIGNYADGAARNPYPVLAELCR